MPKKKDKGGKATGGGLEAYAKEIEDLEAIVDDDKVLKHAVVFTLELEIEQTAIEGYNIQGSFMAKDQQKEGDGIDVFETPLIEEWEEKSSGDDEAEDAGAKGGKKDKKPAKKDKGKKKEKKKGKEKKDDAPADGEPAGPKTVVFKQDFGPFRITNDFAEKLSKTTFYVYLVH
jgi:hypothetical protein